MLSEEVMRLRIVLINEVNLEENAQEVVKCKKSVFLFVFFLFFYSKVKQKLTVLYLPVSM